MLTKELIGNAGFIKFDADVVFDKEILKRLIDCSYENALCVDRGIHLDKEEIKVIVDDENNILKVSKTIDPKKAIGESIGIEIIGKHTAKLLFQELEIMMQDKRNHQAYYEGAYERLIESNVDFYALDISGLKWIEIDTADDFTKAQSIFGKSV